MERSSEAFPFNGPVSAPGERFVLERVLGHELVAALDLDGGQLIATSPGRPDVEFTFAAPQDQAAMVAAVSTGVDAVEDRFLVELAARHPYRDVLFEPAIDVPVAFGPISLLRRPASFLYRLRRADAQGRVSEGGLLAAHAAQPRVRGIRQILNWHPDPRCRVAPKPDLMLDPGWRAGFARLARHRLSFDLQLYWPQMDMAGALAGSFPRSCPTTSGCRSTAASKAWPLGRRRCRNLRRHRTSR